MKQLFLLFFLTISYSSFLSAQENDLITSFPLKMKVIYTFVENPIQVYPLSTNLDDYRISTDNGLVEVKNNIIKITPIDFGKASIFLVNNLNDTIILNYRVKIMPDPLVYFQFNGKSYKANRDSISSIELEDFEYYVGDDMLSSMDNPHLQLRLLNFDFDTRIKTLEQSIRIIKSSGNTEMLFNIESMSLSMEVTDIIKTLEKGDELIFDSITFNQGEGTNDRVLRNQRFIIK